MLQGNANVEFDDGDSVEVRIEDLTSEVLVPVLLEELQAAGVFQDSAKMPLKEWADKDRRRKAKEQDEIPLGREDSEVILRASFASWRSCCRRDL